MAWKQILITVEDERIRNHLENTERLMRNADISHLSETQKQNRLELIDYLHDYWNLGVFPINTDFPMLRLPHIKDKFGTPCAMAYLIEQEGNQALCDDLLKTNNVFIKDISVDHDLIKWCTENGITQEEACQVQPSYSCGMNGTPECVGGGVRLPKRPYNPNKPIRGGKPIRGKPKPIRGGKPIRGKPKPKPIGKPGPIRVRPPKFSRPAPRPYVPRDANTILKLKLLAKRNKQIKKKLALRNKQIKKKLVARNQLIKKKLEERNRLLALKRKRDKIYHTNGVKK